MNATKNPVHWFRERTPRNNFKAGYLIGKILGAILVILISLPRAQAARNYYLADCSQLTFEDCIYRGLENGVFVKYIENGDTIILPAGSGTWGNPLTASGTQHGNNGIIYVNNAITVKGQGDATVITMHENGAVYASGVIALMSQVVWRDMKIKGAGDRPVTCFNIGANGVRITNVTYEGQPDLVPNNGQTGDGYFVFSQGKTGTLIDHCRISAAIGSHEWIFTRGPTDAWQNPNSLGTAQQDVFVEDCIFTNTGYSDANANGRQVFRFNTITGNIKFDAHGAASNSPSRSFRNVEYYNNIWTNPGLGNAATIEIRGGTAMVFNNASASGTIMLRDYLYDNAWPNFGQYNVTITGGTPTSITTQSPHGLANGWPVLVDCAAQNIYGFFPVTVISPYTFTVNRPEATNGIGYNIRRFYTPYDYPLPDQVGNGRDGGPREPAYLWGNTQAGGTWSRTVLTPSSGAQTLFAAQTGKPSTIFSERDVVQANRDFFASSGFDLATGISVGTSAQMNAYTPAIPGYGWWVTDEGSWNAKLPANTSGRLYKWTGGTWSLFYTPYPYPHPLQTATECAQPEPSAQGGPYEYTQTVTLRTSPSDATIRYTTNGTTPTGSIGSIYSGPISISATSNLKAIAYKNGLTDSPILDVTYTITGTVFQPVSSVQTGNYHGTQTVGLSCSTTGSEIRYTLDGSIPTAASTLYSAPLKVDRTKTIRAIGIKNGLGNSPILTIDIAILLETGNWNVVTTSQQLLEGGYRTGFAYFTASATGNLTKISVYGTNTSATQDFEFGLYHDIDGDNAAGNLEKVPGSPAQFLDVGTWTAKWKDFGVNMPVTAGEKYWIFVAVSESGVTGITAGGVGAGYPWDRWNGNTGSIGEAWASVIAFTSNRDAWVYNVKGTISETGLLGAATPNTAPAVQIRMMAEPPK